MLKIQQIYGWRIKAKTQQNIKQQTRGKKREKIKIYESEVAVLWSLLFKCVKWNFIKISGFYHNNIIDKNKYNRTIQYSED